MTKHPTDVFVGSKIRQRRRAIGMTQETLAAALGLAFQQIQKYETGMNRVSASKLFEIARVQKVKVGHYFAGLDDSLAEFERHKEDPRAVGAFEWLRSDQALRVALAMADLPDNAQRAILVQAETLAGLLDSHHGASFSEVRVNDGPPLKSRDGFVSAQPI